MSFYLLLLELVINRRYEKWYLTYSVLVSPICSVLWCSVMLWNPPSSPPQPDTILTAIISHQQSCIRILFKLKLKDIPTLAMNCMIKRIELWKESKIFSSIFRSWLSNVDPMYCEIYLKTENIIIIIQKVVKYIATKGRW